MDTTTPRLIAINGRLHYDLGNGRTFPAIRGGDGDPVALSDLLTQAADPSSIEDSDVLATLDADITAAAEAAAGGELNDEVLAQLTAAGEAVQAIRAELATREQAAAQLAADAEAALALVRGEPAASDEDPEADPEADPAGDDPEADPEATPAPEPDAVVVTEPAADPAPTEVAEPIAAGANPLRRPIPATPARVVRPASTSPRPASVTAGAGLAGLSLTAAANAPGVTAGSPITDYDQLAAAFLSAIEATRGYTHGPRTKVKIATSGRGIQQYPESHRLDRNVERNMDRITAAQRAVQAAGGIPAAVVAAGGPNNVAGAGGICSPQQVNYDMPTVGSTARPTRDGFMMRFGADRGGVRTLPMPLLGDVSDAISIWTEANDTTPADPTTKPCMVVTCPDEDETVVEAIVRCLEFGNFRARYFPEQIEAWMRIAAVEQARVAEQQLLAATATGSVATTVGQVLGTTRTLLAGLDRAISVWRYRHRVEDSFSLAWALPRWIKDQVRTDIARQLPTNSVSDTLAVTDAEIEAWFAVRNVNPVWLMDGESGQRFNVQGVGPIQGWPSTVKTYLAPAGSWLFLDGGNLDLGIVRDSTLNSTNDVQVFAETMEGAHFHGIESWTVTFDTCPDGSVSSTVDIDPCTTGS